MELPNRSEVTVGSLIDPENSGDWHGEKFGLSRAEIMEKAVWGGAVDNLGGDMLSWFPRTTVYGGNVASIGLAASHKLETTVMPFILRGVNLLGINAVDTPRDLRVEIWGRIGSDLKPQHLAHIVTGEIGLDELTACVQDWLDGSVTGRKLVKL